MAHSLVGSVSVSDVWWLRLHAVDPQDFSERVLKATRVKIPTVLLEGLCDRCIVRYVRVELAWDAS